MLYIVHTTTHPPTLAGVGSLGPSLLPVSTPLSLSPSTSAEIEAVMKVEGALANEVGLIVLTQLENFAALFKVGSQLTFVPCVGIFGMQLNCTDVFTK